MHRTREAWVEAHRRHCRDALGIHTEVLQHVVGQLTQRAQASLDVVGHGRGHTHGGGSNGDGVERLAIEQHLRQCERNADGRHHRRLGSSAFRLRGKHADDSNFLPADTKRSTQWLRHSGPKSCGDRGCHNREGRTVCMLPR